MKRFLERLFTENLVLKLLSLLAAVVLWMVILNIDDPVNTKTYMGVSVTVANESVITNSGMIYQIENGSSTVSVTVKARRSVLTRITSDRIQAVADMKNMTLDSLVPIEATIPGFEGSYESAVATPKNMEISIEKNDTVRLPISVSTTGQLEDGYFIESTSVSPSTLVISGPETQVAKVASIVVRADVSRLSATETLTGKLLFYGSSGELIDSTVLTSNVAEEDIYVTVKVLPTKEVPIEAVTVGTPAIGYELSEVECEPGTVRVIGRSDALEKVEKIVINSDQLDLEGVENGLEIVCDLNEYLPEGISLAEGTADKVMVTVRIERAGTAMIEYPVGSIVIDHVPEGYRVGYGALAEVKLEFMGSVKVLEDLAADDLKVSIDLSGCTKAGVYEVPVRVECPDNCMLDKDVTISVNLVKE